MKKSNESRLGVFEFIVVIFLMFLMMTFMTMISKDLLLFLLTSTFLWFVGKGKKTLIFWCLLVVLYAIFFRAYWVIIVFYFLLIHYAINYKVKYVYILISAPVLLFILSILFSVILGVDLDHFRMEVNEHRLTGLHEDSRTMILPYVYGGGLIISWLNAFVTWIFLMFPIPLIMLKSPYYVINAMFIMFIFMGLLRALKIISKNEVDNKIIASFSLVYSFSVIQSIFEPDYGSFLRHLAPIFPLIVFVLLSVKKKTLKESNN
jgi:hypothetical protein